MSKYKKLAKLYSQFVEGEPEEIGQVKGKFVCTHGKTDECDFRPRGESCWTPWIGDDDCNFLVVAEAPSAGGGKTSGAYVAPMLANVNEGRKSRSDLGVFVDFLKESFDLVPYFTDAVKCGVKRQSGEKKIDKLMRRFEYCKKFLTQEIEIIKPNFIITVGAFARDRVDELLVEMGKEKQIRAINILHYSANAQIWVGREDKAKYVWPLQLSDLIEHKKVESKLSDLSYFKKGK